MSRFIDFTPKGIGWGTHSYDWMGGMATFVSGRIDEITLNNASNAWSRLNWLAGQHGTTAQCLMSVACTYAALTPPPTLGAASMFVQAGLPSVGDVMKIIFGGEISEYGRPINIRDIGTTNGGIITVSGWISVQGHNLVIEIDLILAHGPELFVYQGLNAAMDTAYRRGLSGVTISGTIMNPKITNFLSQIAAMQPGAVIQTGAGVTTVYLPVPGRE